METPYTNMTLLNSKNGLNDPISNRSYNSENKKIDNLELKNLFDAK